MSNLEAKKFDKITGWHFRCLHENRVNGFEQMFSLVDISLFDSFFQEQQIGSYFP